MYKIFNFVVSIFFLLFLIGFVICGVMILRNKKLTPEERKRFREMHLAKRERGE